MPDDMEWIIMGDLNLIRSPDDRNKPRGDIKGMLLFNETISNIGLLEIPLKGRNSYGVTCNRNLFLRS
jgi:hypothetical protein